MRKAWTADDVSEKYTGPAIAVHWLTAVLIVANLVLGLSMVALAITPQKLQWYIWHKWIGITVFLLTCARLAWRAIRPHPAAVAMSLWQHRVAMVSHLVLYVLLLAIPVSGWIYSSATGVQVVYLGLLPLPDLVPKDKALAGTLKTVHVTLNLTLVLLVCVHTVATLRHHFVDKDAVLARMLPGIRPKGTVR